MAVSSNGDLVDSDCQLADLITAEGPVLAITCTVHLGTVVESTASVQDRQDGAAGVGGSPARDPDSDGWYNHPSPRASAGRTPSRGSRAARSDLRGRRRRHGGALGHVHRYRREHERRGECGLAVRRNTSNRVAQPERAPDERAGTGSPSRSVSPGRTSPPESRPAPRPRATPGRTNRRPPSSGRAATAPGTRPRRARRSSTTRPPRSWQSRRPRSQACHDRVGRVRRLRVDASCARRDSRARRARSSTPARRRGSSTRP